MTFITGMPDRQPLLSALIAIFLMLLFTTLLFALFASQAPLGDFADSLARLAASALLLGLLARRGLWRRAWLTSPSLSRGRYWPAVAALMCVLVVHAYLKDQVDLAGMRFDGLRVPRWLLRTYGAGIWEELLFRVVVFYLLYRAWGRTRRGLFAAATAQALLFGAMHLLNLRENNDVGAVLFQTGYAAMIGFGFAGLTLYSGSVWPAVLLHGSINAAGNFDAFFAVDGYDFPVPGVLGDTLLYALFLSCGALPGYWCLLRAPLKDTLGLQDSSRAL